MSYDDDERKPDEGEVSADAVDALFDEPEEDEDELEGDKDGKSAFGDDGELE